MRRWLPDFWIILGLFLIPLVFFFPVTLGGRTVIPADNLYQYEPWASVREDVGVPETPHNALLSDLVLQNYQWKHFIRENIDDPEIPLWQPNQLSGSPFLANGQHSMLYPLSVIYYVMPLAAAFGWFAVVQLWLAGLWMYLYIRGIGLGRLPGLVAAITVQLSSFFVVATVHPMIQAGAAWLPLLLLMTEFTIQRRPFPGTGGRAALLPWVLIGGVTLGIVHLAGHLEITYYTLLITAFYAGCRLLVVWWAERTQWRTPVVTGLMLVLMVVLGFALGAIQFIPNIEAANQSFRTEREQTVDDVLGYALPNRHIARWIMPSVYGNPAHHEYLDVFAGENVSMRSAWQTNRPDAPSVSNTDFGIKNYVEGGAYVGILPLVLALIGIAGGLQAWREHGASSPPPFRGIFLGLLVLAASFAFGTPTYRLFYAVFPGIDQLHTPFRWIWAITISLAVLTAFGVQALQSHAQQPVARRNIRRLGWVLIALGGAVLGGLAASYIFYDTAEALIDRLYTGLAKAQDTFPSVKSFYSYQFGNVLGLGAFLAAAGGILWLSTRPTVIGRGRWKVPPWQPLAIIVILIDLFIATYDFNPRADPDWLEYKPESVAWLQWRIEAEGPFRIQAYNWGEEPLNANSGWRYGLHDVRGYDSLFSQDYAALMGQIAPQGGLDHNRIDSIYYNNPQALADPWLDFLNVRYIITDWLIREEDNPAALGYRLVHTDAGVRIYENLDALPRAYTLPVPDNGVAYQPGEGCLFESAVRPEEPRHLTYFPPINGACIPVQPAAITQYDDTEVRIDALIDEDVWLILADNYAEGWHAFVKPKGEPDDAEEEIDLAQVNLNLRGVKLPPGAWTVRFKYSPPSFQVGGFVSFVAGMLAVFAALVWLWRAFVSETTQEDTGRRLIKNSAAPIGLNLFNRGIDFAFAFIMLRILGPADAGIYYYAIVIFGWFDIFTNFGLNTLLTRDVSREPGSAGRYLYNTSILRLGLAGLGIPALALVLLIRNTTVDPALDPTAVAAIILLYIGLVPNSISTGLTALFYAFERAEFPAAMTTVSTLIKVTLGLAALLLGWGVVGLAGVSIITNLVTFLVLGRLAWPLLRENWQPVPDGALQRTMLREAWPLMINHLLATIFFKSDVILMEAINGVSVVGIYSTAYKWLDALNIIPAFFTMALLPVLSRQAHTHQEALRRNYVLGTKILFMLALPVAVMTTFLAPILVGILGGRQFLPDGAVALQLMIWSIPVGWMNSLTQYVLIALDRQRQITGAFIAAVSFNIITNLAFLPVYSFRAAAITTILSEIVLFVGFFWLIRQVIGTIHWPMRLWKIAFATGMMLVITASLWTIAPFAGLMAGPLLYVIILWWLKPFDSDEEARLSTVLPGRLQRLVLRRAPQAP